ncbi:hypothetical protein INT45_003996 [Circinella minor]|uniref:Uncharacterized protein n=1 Tax=Circinella minor TaxID=1195481 RepID=A0A8H7RHP0_9FUNG|nr:hypothetical protein INT45_003996 [Circinella minor]
MPFPSKRQKAAKAKQRNQIGCIIANQLEPIEISANQSEEVEHLEILPNDWEILELSYDTVQYAVHLPLVWSKNGGSSFRGVYNKDSPVTIWRKSKEIEVAAKISRKLTDFHGFHIGKDMNSSHPQVSQSEIMVLRQETFENNYQVIKKAYMSLTKLITPNANTQKKKKKIESSDLAAIDCWIDPSKGYRRKAIRCWANEFLDFGFISEHQQGKNAKRESILSDETIEQQIREWITNHKVEQCNLPNLLKFVNMTILPEELRIPGTISHTTLWRFMHEWGYVYRKNNKDIYYDGHDRADVVKYRQAWAKRMMQYRERMETYKSDAVETVIEPALLASAQKKLVLVTHNESTFYANDGKQTLWLQEGETVLRNKSPGQSIMISEFQCPCHGTMRSAAWTSWTYFYAGTNREGYWTSKDMIKQLTENTIPLFEILHADAQAVFIFDQSSNHNAYPRDALLAHNMPKAPRRCGVIDDTHNSSNHEFRSGKYFCDKQGKEIEQDLYEQFKGVEKILKERGLWNDKDPYRFDKAWRMECKKEPEVDGKCCAKHLLAMQADFQGQKSALYEAIENSGHIFELYPKFHCECNWIKRYWGAAKREARVRCDYTFKGLKDNLPLFLDEISPPDQEPIIICHFYNKAWRFIEAYSQDKPTKEAMELVEKYSNRTLTSHRRVHKND